MRDRATLRDKVVARIARRRDAVFLTREFRDLGGEDQVLRALRELVREKRLLRRSAARALQQKGSIAAE